MSAIKKLIEDVDLLEAFKVFTLVPEPAEIRAARTELLIVFGRWAAAKGGGK